MDGKSQLSSSESEWPAAQPKKAGHRQAMIQCQPMAETCNWIVFHAHPTHFIEAEDKHPDFFGVFVCPASRREPEQLLKEVLTNRKLFLAEIRETRSVAKATDWGMNERLKAQVDEEGFGLSLTKMNTITVPVD